MKVLVCGGRDFNDYDLVYRTMGEIDHNHWNGAVHISEIIQGGAKGADALAERWAEEMGVPVIVFHADWKSGARAAGPIRNSKMLEYGPDLVVAFPGGRGTADMVSKAKRKGVEVIEVPMPEGCNCDPNRWADHAPGCKAEMTEASDAGESNV